MSNNRASPPWKAVIKRSFAANIKENKQAGWSLRFFPWGPEQFFPRGPTVTHDSFCLPPVDQPISRSPPCAPTAGPQTETSFFAVSPARSTTGSPSGSRIFPCSPPIYGPRRLSRSSRTRGANCPDPTVCTYTPCPTNQISLTITFSLARWFPATGDQFRITGRLHPVAHHDSQIFPSTAVPSHLLTHFNHIDISKSAKALSSISQLIPHKSGTRFSWDAERQRQWQLIPDDIRATYTWPTPGELQSESADAATNPWLSSLEIPEKEKGLFKHLPDKEKGIFKHHESDKDKAKALEEGFKRFVVLVMEVEEVDHIRLHEKPHTGRTVYKRRDDAGDWSIAGVNP
ncbi:hypothetical protein BC936DRAFT_145790 [Jimgerdemannia flammicorona]|uniref:Pyridoxamine 5'-phosphate oxidase Alr4036 family FMN-binding domain-containing protein n=1 Tax=Jimgerdemannia flammicorona TaxID=994334 RepID=A0A433D923_9FUNG|nr:hypothetical protein BC936DRAFT_145790 [Jimgerdemannia flammicorona]